MRYRTPSGLYPNSSNGKRMAELSFLTCNIASCQLLNRWGLRKLALANREVREVVGDPWSNTNGGREVCDYALHSLCNSSSIQSQRSLQ